MGLESVGKINELLMQDVRSIQYAYGKKRQ